jgi:hypothetical protein
MEPVYPAQWLKDGSFLYLNRSGKFFYRLKPGSQPETLLKSDYSKDAPRVSPDGRWVVNNTDWRPDGKRPNRRRGCRMVASSTIAMPSVY